MALLDGARRVCFFHAHPDDETLATGALIVGLVADGVEVAVVTATRGERGEVVDGPLKVLEGTSALVVAREHELAGALAELGVETHAFLGTAPARAEGLPARVYRDSGMRWVTPSLAGPSVDAGPDSLTSASVSDAAADLAAFLARWHPDVLITYDDLGGYGHPDHVACHHIAAAALSAVEPVETLDRSLTGELGEAESRSLRSERQRASRRVDDPELPESFEPIENPPRSLRSERQRASRRVADPELPESADEPVGTPGPSDLDKLDQRSMGSVVEPRISVVEPVETPPRPRFVQVVSEPRLGSVPGEEFDGSRWLDTVKAALRWHASQLTVDGDDVVHSGGQRQPIVTRVMLR